MFIVESIIGLGILAAVVYVVYNMLNKPEHTVTAAVQKAVATTEKTVSKAVAAKPAKATTAKAKAPKPAAKPTAAKPAKEKKPKAAAKA